MPSAVEPSQTSIGNLQGSVHGGQSPVTGAQIYLFAAGTGGYGTASTSLMTSGDSGVSCSNPAVTGACYVTTDVNGNFAVGGDYTCTSGQQVYMVAVGGNPGLASAAFTTGGTFSNASNTITVASATWVYVGMTVSGTGVGGTVTAVSGTTVTLSQQTTAASTGSGVAVTFSVPATTATFSKSSTTITLSSATDVKVGMTVSGTGVGGTVTGVSGTTITLSQQTTAAGSAVPVTFTMPITNTGIVQMAGLGQCPLSGSMAAQVPYLVINEVTTVALAYSMGGFGTDAFHIASSGTASGKTGIANAMANANNIIWLPSGVALTTAIGNTNSVAPQSKINTLADILSTCVNGTNAWSGTCLSLFSNAENASGTEPTDESTAMFNIVHYPTKSVSGLYSLYVPSAQVFLPALSSAPTDWTMPVIYKSVISTPGTSNPITTGPYEMAFDASGNAWIGDRTNGVVEIGPQGAVTAFTNSKYGFKMVKGVAVSPEDGSIWVSDYGNNDVYVMSSTGTQLSTITQNMKSAGPILTAFASNPAGGDYLAFQATETSPAIVVFDAGTYAQDHNADSTNYANVSDPGWITVDNTGTAWIPSTGTTYIGSLAVEDKSATVKYTSSETNVGETYQTVAEAEGAASDGLGNVWAPSGAALYEVSAGDVSAAYTGGGMNSPSKTFVDGSNVVWVASASANIVSGFYTTPAAQAGKALATNGFSTGAVSGTGCSVIGVDPSGNVWAGNSDQSVTELLGLGTPTAAPLYGGNTVITGTVTTVTKGNLGTEP